MMKTVFLALALTVGMFSHANILTVENNFRNIPDSQQLAVYWYWVAGNMSKEGVVKDLQAMKKVGR